MKKLSKSIMAMMVGIFLMTGIATINIHAQTIDTPSSWAYDQVRDAIDLDIVPLHLQSHFTQAITRAEFSTLAVVLYETTTGIEIAGRIRFDDTTDINVEKLAYLGIVSGVGDNRFDPYSLLTREQAAVMLARLFHEIHDVLNTTDLPVMLDMPYLPGIFADYGQISSWALNGIASAYALGLMRGVGDQRFSPQEPYTREQSIVTMMRIIDSVHDFDPYLHRIGDARIIKDVTVPTLVEIYIPDGMFAAALELIYEDEHHRYYLSAIMSGSIVLTFMDGTEMTLREALDQQKVTIDDLILSGLNVIITPAHVMNRQAPPSEIPVHLSEQNESSVPTLVKIYIPDGMFATALEFIYEDEYHRYYLPAIMSGSIVLTFMDGAEMTLREALDQQKVTIADLILSGLDIIAVPR